ncbi:hypothetical protein PDE_05601 [Penicillium oxalicum 114-2]|uniref:Uncharacterized protein n=1 Tax=Penicillium oxalicum (strain 114-2 / CGMCC 5302) TaxID=933388 RepID=S7ZK16_PENO1|nr:hypothetical protein PDE_05601 [Penicillium oxalicum 114-2]
MTLSLFHKTLRGGKCKSVSPRDQSTAPLPYKAKLESKDQTRKGQKKTTGTTTRVYDWVDQLARLKFAEPPESHARNVQSGHSQSQPHFAKTFDSLRPSYSERGGVANSRPVLGGDKKGASTSQHVKF